MSDSPKYSTPSLQQQQEQQLLAERQRQEREAAARRAAEEERRRQERLAEERRLLEQWTQEQKRATDAVGSARDLVGSIGADAIVRRWAAEDIRALQSALDEASSLVSGGRFQEATSKADVIRRGAEACVARANDLQLSEDRRQYIIDGMLSVLREMGFIVGGGSPALSDPSLPTSDVLIQARRLGGGALALSIPQEGDILYDVDGYSRRLQAGQDGGTYKTCDEAERDISLVHEMLESEFGIHMSELMWDGKPRGISKQQQSFASERPEAKGRG